MSPTFRQIYDALDHADRSKVNLTIRPASYLRNEANTMAGPSETSRGAWEQGTIKFAPGSDQATIESRLEHEIVHAAGQFFGEVKSDLKGLPIDATCGRAHPNTNNPCVVPVEDQIHREVDAARPKER